MNFRGGKNAWRRTRPDATVDMTPLIDVVFLLLIFLLVTTTFRQDEFAFSIALPTSSADQVEVTTDKTTVFVEEDGQLHLLMIPADAPAGTASDAQKVDVAALKVALEALRQRRPDAPVAIRGGKGASFQQMVDIVAILEDAGIRNIWFPYEREDK